MQVVLYLMLSLNLLMCTIGYVNGDQAQVHHALTFAAVASVGLVAMRMRDHE